MIELVHEENVVRIKIVGVGGGGTNAVERMTEERIPMVEYIAINTDDASVHGASAEVSLQIGLKTTQGRGAGANPEIGRLSALENTLQIKEAIKDCDMLFIVAGMGGGTGTGAAPIVASVAHELDILTVAVVTKPFYFEGRRRLAQAEAGIELLEKEVDAIIVIPNDNLKLVEERKITFDNALAIADGVLMQTVKNIVDVIQRTAVVNCDFADIRSVIRSSGYIHTATGKASGENKASEVIDQIKTSKLLGTKVDCAQGALLCITAPGSVSLEEVELISSAVTESVSTDANVIFGIDFDETMGDEIKAVLIATHNREQHKS